MVQDFNEKIAGVDCFVAQIVAVTEKHGGGLEL
jgi:hypothetical protein